MSARFEIQQRAVHEGAAGESIPYARDVESRMVSLFLFLASCAVVLALLRAARELFVPTARYTNLVFAIVMASLFLLEFVRPRRTLRTRLFDTAPTAVPVDTTRRITCIGCGFGAFEPNELRLQRFEPYVVRCLGLVFVSRGSILCACIAGVLGGGLGYIFSRYANVISGVNEVIFCAGMASFVGRLGMAVCFPLYLRVVPGRLEILQYHVFGSKPRIVVCVDTSIARMCFDFVSFRVSLLVSSTRLVIPFRLVRERERFCARLVASALARVPAPILGFDELVT